MKTKQAFHELIDQIEDEERLKGYLSLIQRLNNNQTGELWNSLSATEKDELILSYQESLDPDNLISHDTVKSQHDKWLKK